jgi:hypothetical protein
MDKKDLAQDKKMIKTAIGKHEKNMHQGMKPTKLKKGGPTSLDRKTYGKNLSRAMNQKSGSK